MASKTSIPRFLLPQYGAIWRTAARTAPFARPVHAELGQVLVRYASKAASTAKSTTPKATTTTSKTAAAKKVAAPKAASTKATAAKTATTKASTAKTASTKTSPPKTAPTKAPATKAPAPKAATPKTPASQPVVKAAPSLSAVSKPAAPTPIVKTAVPQTPTPPAAAAAAAAAAPKVATPDPSKPIVLEKPERFNPPSHGSRLPRSTPKHYGGPLSQEEVQSQKKKEYPGMPPPENTWAHWFFNNRHIHMFITLGTLGSLAVYTFVARFNATSPYADMIPAISEFPSHPIDYIATCLEVLKLHEEHISAETAEMRRRKVDDVSKRNEYRKAHGLNTAQGIESWTGMTKSSTAGPFAAASDAAVPVTAPIVDDVPESQSAGLSDLQVTDDGKRKKFWGIF
ncbi:hypothetical protein BJ170DRAFT_480250 [Xylariales sp. AK1849]|nr:hypothetical protein BJ170DRAFT_480250 [Xylariales sp. AK1849]